MSKTNVSLLRIELAPQNINIVHMEGWRVHGRTQFSEADEGELGTREGEWWAIWDSNPGPKA